MFRLSTDRNVTQDFLNRIEGQEALITAGDIYKAVKWSVEADASARALNNLQCNVNAPG